MMRRDDWNTSRQISKSRFARCWYRKGLKVYWRKLWSCLDDRWYRAIRLWEGLRRLSRIETKFLSNSVEFHFDEYLHSENQRSVEKMKSSTRMLRVHFLLRQFARLTDLDLETCEALREGDEKGGRWKHRFKQGWEKIRADIGECFPSKGHPGGILKKIPRFVFFPFFPLFPSSFLLVISSFSKQLPQLRQWHVNLVG